MLFAMRTDEFCLDDAHQRPYLSELHAAAPTASLPPHHTLIHTLALLAFCSASKCVLKETNVWSGGQEAMPHGPSGRSDSLCKVLLELSQDHHFICLWLLSGLRDCPTCHEVQGLWDNVTLTDI